MAHNSYAGDVLQQALKLAAENGGEVRVQDVAATMFTQTRKENKRVLNIMAEHARDGRLRRIRQGVYGPLLPGAIKLDKREVMWRMLRLRKRVTVEDMMEAADVSKEYAREWLRMLEVKEVVRKEQAPGCIGMWFLIRDSVEMPVDTEKAEKLRALRKKKKERVETRLTAISEALGEIRMIIAEEDEG